MNLRIATLLCLSASAACSNTTSEPANDPSQIASSSADAEMRPASLDGRPAPGVEASSGNGSARPTGADVIGPNAGSGSQAPSAHGSPSGAASPTTGSSTGSSSTTSSSSTTDSSSTTGSSPPAGPSTSTAAQPDNTKVNERDTDTAALTPIDQGNNEADLKMTQQIRQAVMANDSLSFTAKNVKIITNGGKVTLRGPVKTAAERDAIDAAARKVAGARVDNQIEVKK